MLGAEIYLERIWKALAGGSGKSGSIIQISGTKSASGDNTVVASPGATQQIVVSAFTIQNESDTATTMILQNGSDTTDAWRNLGQNQGDGLAMTLKVPWRLDPGAALILNLSGANSCGFNVQYWIE